MTTLLAELKLLGAGEELIIRNEGHAIKITRLIKTSYETRSVARCVAIREIEMAKFDLLGKELQRMRDMLRSPELQLKKDANEGRRSL